jgi:hypothetical protein
LFQSLDHFLRLRGKVKEQAAGEFEAGWSCGRLKRIHSFEYSIVNSIVKENMHYAIIALSSSTRKRDFTCKCQGGSMQTPNHRNATALVVFGLILVLVVWLAFSSTTWAAPGAQGTVPTPPGPTDTFPTRTAPTDAAPTTAAPTNEPPPSDDGGNDNDDGGDQGNGNDDGGDAGGNAQPTAPAAPGAGSVCAIGDTGAQCAATDLIVAVGAGAASPGSALTIEGSFPQPPCPASPSGQNFLNRCFRYAWIGTNAEPLSSISAPVQYCISYGAEQLAAAKNDPEAMLIGLAGADGTWSMLKPTADTASNRTCATSNQLFVWSALFVPENPSQLLPTVGAPQNSWWLAALASVGIVLLVAAGRLRRTR